MLGVEKPCITELDLLEFNDKDTRVVSIDVGLPSVWFAQNILKAAVQMYSAKKLL